MLVVYNIVITLAVLFMVRNKGTTKSLPLNQPPTGVTPSVAHLITEPAAHFINISWFPDGQFYRDHDSDELDAKWADYNSLKGSYLYISKEEAP